MNRPTWDQMYMTMCYLVASRSRDLSTHAGVVIVAPDMTIRTVGYNSFPRGIDYEGEIGDDGLPSRHSRIDGEKYLWMEHSERNAIYNACRNGVSLIDCILYVNWLPCMDCARAIISTGIAEVVIHKQGQDAFIHSRGGSDDIWSDSHGVVWSALEEGKVKVRWFEEPLATIEGFFSGKVYDFDSNGDGQVTDNEPQSR